MLSHACEIVSPHAKNTDDRNGQHQVRCYCLLKRGWPAIRRCAVGGCHSSPPLVAYLANMKVTVLGSGWQAKK